MGEHEKRMGPQQRRVSPKWRDMFRRRRIDPVLSPKRESQSLLQGDGKIPRTRRRNALNASIPFSNEDEEFASNRADPVVDLRFERVCVAAIALSPKSLPVRSYHLD
jgi:hypothetical protein